LLAVCVVDGEGPFDHISPVGYGAVTAGKLREEGAKVGARGEAVEVGCHVVPVDAADVGASIVVQKDGEGVGCCVHERSPLLMVVDVPVVPHPPFY
jgi:hypothetical protein